MEESPRHVAPQSGLYTQIAVLAAGNALSLAVFLMLHHVSAVLADFRDPMLYAFLCSVALRGPKDWMVQRLSARLAQPRSLALGLLAAAATPWLFTHWLWHEACKAVAAFNEQVTEVRKDYQKKADKRRRSLDSKPSAVSGSQATPAAGVPTPRQPYNIILYAKAGLRTFTSRKNRRRRRRAGVWSTRRPAPPSSTRLLTWLVVTCAVWSIHEWIMVRSALGLCVSRSLSRRVAMWPVLHEIVRYRFLFLIPNCTQKKKVAKDVWTGE
jgi:hypothetical protein